MGETRTRTFREKMDFYQQQYKIAANLLREIAVLGAECVLEDFPQYPDGDPRDAEEIIDSHWLKVAPSRGGAGGVTQL